MPGITGEAERQLPRPATLLALALSAIALIATSPGPSTLNGHVVGQVILGAGEVVERQVLIGVLPGGGGATKGYVAVRLQAASGLDVRSSDGVRVSLVEPSGQAALSTAPIPVDRCAESCELLYQVAIQGSPDLLPGSIVRYEVDVTLEYAQRGGTLPLQYLSLDLEGAARGPVAPVWSVLAGLVALVVGILAGPSLDRRLDGAWRPWPAAGLLVLVGGGVGWVLLTGLNLWSLGLLGTLAWGLGTGARKWPLDGGWRLGLAGVAVAGLGGLWLSWWSTRGDTVQPILLTTLFVVLGSVAGIVIGQAWRTDMRTRRDRWWAALSILSHGILIGGFASLGAGALVDPVSGGGMALAFGPAVLLAAGLRQWLGGKPNALLVFDALILGAGLLGTMAWFIGLPTFSSDTRRYQLADVAVVVACVASLIAVATAARTIRRSGVQRPASGTDVAAVSGAPGSLAGDPPAT